MIALRAALDAHRLVAFFLAYLLASGCFWGIFRSFPSVQLLAGGGGNARDFWKFQSSNENPMLRFGRAEKHTGFFGIPVAEWVCDCAWPWVQKRAGGLGIPVVE